MSACEVGNQQFVEAVTSRNKGMHSIVAPAQNIDYDHAAAIWSSFYASMFTTNRKAMKSADISRRFEALKLLFPVEFYMAFYSPKNDEWRTEHT